MWRTWDSSRYREILVIEIFFPRNCMYSITLEKVVPARRGSRDFSYRVLASVRIPCRCALSLTEVASKHADSQRIFFVSSETAESMPPIIPASATGHLSSAMIISSEVSSYSLPFSDRIFSHFFACLTHRYPTILSASKACIGWPSSVMMRFVISTMSIFGVIHARSIMRDIPKGLFSTCIFSILIVWYERQNFVWTLPCCVSIGAIFPSSVSTQKLSPSRNIGCSYTACHSRAFPTIENRSGRFVINLLSISNVVSLRGNWCIAPFLQGKGSVRSKNNLPTIFSRRSVSQKFSSIMIHDDLSCASQSSSSEQIIPRLSIPAIGRSAMMKSPGRTEPIMATATYVASCIFSAPVRIVSSPCIPWSTRTIESFFDSGCFSHESIFATTTRSIKYSSRASISAVWVEYEWASSEVVYFWRRVSSGV